jgi:hypothetical protein
MMNGNLLIGRTDRNRVGYSLDAGAASPMFPAIAKTKAAVSPIGNVKQIAAAKMEALTQQNSQRLGPQKFGPFNQGTY